MVTDEKDTSFYPAASLEPANINNEKIFYTGLDNGVVDRTTVANYPTNDTYTIPNGYTQKLRGDGVKIGAGILLKVMAGDKINVHASSWYKFNSATPNTPVNPLNDVVAALIATVPTASGAKITSGQIGGTVLNPSVTGFLNSRDANNNASQPDSWLNIVVFDEQMNPVITGDGKNSYFEQVGGENGSSVKPYNIPDREITKNGYVYVYVSNETPNISVYWDNLQVTHIKGQLLQEEGYYPFGLEMKAISSQAATKMQTRYKFNAGSELEDNFDVSYYETSFRQYDAQIGRFTGIDILAASYATITPYQFGGNNPISINDPTGAAMFYNNNYGTRRFEERMRRTVSGKGMASEDLWMLGSMDFNGGGFEDEFWSGGRGGGGAPLTDEGLTKLWNSKYGGGWSAKRGYQEFTHELFNLDKQKLSDTEIKKFQEIMQKFMSISLGLELIQKLGTCGETINVTHDFPRSGSNPIMEYQAGTNTLAMGDKLSEAFAMDYLVWNLSHELFHAYQDFSPNAPSVGREVDAYIFESLFARQYGLDENFSNAIVIKNSSTTDAVAFKNAWNNFFNNGYSTGDYNNIFKYFISGSTVGNGYKDKVKGTLSPNSGGYMIYFFLFNP